MASSSPSYTTTTYTPDYEISLYKKPTFTGTVTVSEIFSDLLQMCRGLSPHLKRVDISEDDGQANIHFEISNKKMQIMLVCEQYPKEERVVYIADCYLWLESVKTLFTVQNEEYSPFMHELVALLENHNIANRVLNNNTPPSHWGNIEENEHVKSWVDVSSAYDEMKTVIEESAKSLSESWAAIMGEIVNPAQEFNAAEAVSKPFVENYPYSLNGLKEDD